VNVRLAADAAPWLPTARTVDRLARADGATLTIAVHDVEVDTPRVVTALAAAGAPILEVRPELPALEDVYLHLIEASR
jgi:hypothetical protein